MVDISTGIKIMNDIFEEKNKLSNMANDELEKYKNKVLSNQGGTTIGQKKNICRKKTTLQ